MNSSVIIIEHEVGKLSDKIQRKDKFKPEYLKAFSKAFDDGFVVRIPNYQTQRTVSVEEYEIGFDSLVEEMKNEFLARLEFETYLCKTGTILFSPANRFAHSGKKAKEWYLFEYRDDVEGVVELFAESSFICVNEGE